MSRYVFCFRLNGIKNQSSSALALRSSRKSPLQAISNPYHFAFACYVRCTLFVVRCSLFVVRYSLFAVVVVDVVALGFLWLHFEIKDMFVFFSIYHTLKYYCPAFSIVQCINHLA